MIARHDEAQIGYDMRGAAAAVGNRHGETALAIDIIEVGQPHVGLGAAAVGNELAVPDPADQGLHLGMIDAHDRKTIKGDVLDKGR